MSFTAHGLSVIRSGRAILRPTTLTIRNGERVGLVGASGSGKSTLGHALLDELRGQGVNVAHVPQSPAEALDPLRSMEFHWREAKRARALLSERAPETARSAEPDRNELFVALSIDHGDMKKRPWGWSRGMQQRFVIAMALIGKPDLIVLDEPTSALDPVVAARTMTLLDSVLGGMQSAMLLITHDLGLAAKRVDRLLVMHNGAIVEDAATKVMLESPSTPQAKALASHRSWVTVHAASAS